MRRRGRKWRDSRVASTQRKRLSRAEGTLANIGTIVHPQTTFAYSWSSSPHTTVARKSLTLTEDESDQLLGLPARKRARYSVPSSGSLDAPRIPRRPPAQPFSREGRPSSPCRYCGGLTVRRRTLTGAFAVPYAEEYWHCTDPECPGRNVPLVFQY